MDIVLQDQLLQQVLPSGHGRLYPLKPRVVKGSSRKS
jgi:hypothetical protein